MSRPCTICTHASRGAIDQALVDRLPFRQIAKSYGVSTGALQRHYDDHIPELLLKAKEAREAARADDLLEQVRQLRASAQKILDEAMGEGGDRGIGLRAIREIRDCIRLLGELEGKLQAQATVNIIVSPEWRALQAAVLAALQPHPDARLAVAAALGRLTEAPPVVGHV